MSRRLTQQDASSQHAQQHRYFQMPDRSAAECVWTFDPADGGYEWTTLQHSTDQCGPSDDLATLVEKALAYAG